MPSALSTSKPLSHRTSIALLAGLLALGGCGEPPGWQKLLTQRITEQYAGYIVTPTADGNLKVMRPGLPDVAVDVAGIALLCRRGPKDCNYATDEMLTSLQAK